VKGEPKKELRLDLATGDPLAGEVMPVGLKKKLQKAQAFIAENQTLLWAKWSEAHPEPS